jgi:hypothetical protein
VTVTVTVPDPRKSRAVLIGIGDYTHPDLPAMPAAEAGARHLADLLRDPSLWGLPEEHVTVIGSTTPVDQVLGAVRDAALAPRTRWWCTSPDTASGTTTSGCIWR